MICANLYHCIQNFSLKSNQRDENSQEISTVASNKPHCFLDRFYRGQAVAEDHCSVIVIRSLSLRPNQIDEGLRKKTIRGNYAGSILKTLMKIYGVPWSETTAPLLEYQALPILQLVRAHCAKLDGWFGTKSQDKKSSLATG